MGGPHGSEPSADAPCGVGGLISKLLRCSICVWCPCLHPGSVHVDYCNGRGEWARKEQTMDRALVRDRADGLILEARALEEAEKREGGFY